MKKILFLVVLLAVVGVVAAPLVPDLPAEGAKEQLEFYLDAANHGSPRAMLALAHYNEHGIGMDTNRVEALRWYQKILASRGRLSPEILAAAESGSVRLGGDTLVFDEASTNGNYFLDLLAAQTNRETAYLAARTLRHRLLGKTLVFTNLVNTYSQRGRNGSSELMLNIPDECQPPIARDHHAYYPHRFPFMTVRAFFDDGGSRVARLLDQGDRIVRFDGQVVTNWPWHEGLVLKGVSVVPEDAAIADPLPPFDAATITGDELLDYFRRQRRIRKWQYAEVQSRLVGRRLTFHRLRLSGGWGSRGGKIDSSFSITAVPNWERVGEGDIPGSATFRLSFSTDSARRFALGLAQVGSFAQMGEVVGTFAKVEDPNQGWSLQLEDVVLVPKGADVEIAENGSGIILGDEIVRRVGHDFTPVVKLGLCSRFGGREVSFTSGVVDSCRPDWTSNTVHVVCRMVAQRSDGGRRNPLRVSFTIPAETVKTLRRTPIPGDLVVGLKGRIPGLPAVDENSRRRLNSDSGVLELEQPDFSITWRSDVVKLTNLETKTGERIVRRLALCWNEVKADQFLRLARQVDGMAVDFPSGRIHTANTRKDGTALVIVGLEDPLLGECAELTLVVPRGKLAEQAAMLKYGVHIRNIHGVLRAELAKPDDWGAETMCVRLNDATFEIVPPRATSRK
ncbi:MAG: hypothetical protein Q4G65_18000 [bacterium]|nr:hypothetical protein [bacterium]